MANVPVGAFGHLLRRYRLAAAMTQAELAEQAQLSANAISALESGARRSPRKETVALLAKALSLAPAERSALEAAARAYRLTPPPAPPGIPAPSSHARHTWALVGRRHELAMCADHLGAEAAPLLLLSGEPGIGKTRLLEEAATLACASGWTVVAGGCTSRSGQEPYAPLVDALSRCLAVRSPAQQRLNLRGCAWLVRLLPELAETLAVPSPSWQIPPDQERRLIFAAVGRLLANIAGPAGTILMLDDLQWAGPDALDLLGTLVRTADGSLRVLGAFRSTEIQPADPMARMLADLTREGLAAHAEIDPLAFDEAENLLGLLTDGAAGGELAEAVVRRSGGVPFFVVSCARALRTGALDPHSASAVPWDAAQSVLQRVAGLSPLAQQLLGVAAVLGRTFASDTLVMVSGGPEDDVLAALDEVSRARLIVETAGADTYQFTHDLIWEVVEANLGAARRKMWHRRAAEALERAASTETPALLADHFALGGESRKAVLYLERAAEAAAQRDAFAEVDRSLRHALALAPESEQIRLYELLGDLVVGIYGEAATQAYTTALDRWQSQGAEDPRTAVRLLRKLLILYFRGSAGVITWPRPAAQRQMVAEAHRLAAATGDEDEVWRVRVASLFHMVCSDDTTAHEIAESRAVALAASAYFEARGDWNMVSQALDACAGLSMAIGAHDEVLAVSQRRLTLPQLSVLEHDDALSMVALAYFNMGDYDRCIAIVRDAVTQLGPGQPVTFLMMGLDQAAEAAWLTGRWGEVSPFLAAIEAIPGDLWFIAYWVALHMALARTDRAAAATTATLIERSSKGRAHWESGAERALLAACLQDDPSALDLDPAHLGFLSFWTLLFLNEHGRSAPAPFLEALRTRKRTDMNTRSRAENVDMQARTLAIAEALAAGDDTCLAQAIDAAEAHQLISHAARMRVVLAQRTGDRTQLERARPVLQRLGDRQFLCQLERLLMADG